MPSGAPRVLRNALHYLDARYLVPAEGEVCQEITDDKTNEMPLRSVLQARSDFSFVGDMVTRVVYEQGVAVQLAESVVREVVLNPGVALQRLVGGKTEILQAVVVERDITDEEQSLGHGWDVRVILRATVSPKHKPSGEATVPPSLDSWDLQLDEIDLESDRLDHLAEMISWVAEYGAQAQSHREAPLRPAAVLGRPSAMQIQSIPDNWRSLIEAALSTFGLRCTLETDRNRFSGRLDSRTEWIFALDSAMSPMVDLELLDSPHSPALELWGAPFSDLLTFLIDRLLEEAEREDIPPAQYELQRGDTFFHRKVGDSKGGRDHFSDRSEQPICKHDSNWLPFHGDKSRKGMRRIYSSFTNDMLYHCGKYPNCNVYQVRA